jgi:FAD/FMN-containing dehydrogenase
MGRSVLMRGNHALADELPTRVRRPLAAPTSPRWNLFLDFPSGALNRFTVKAFNTTYYAVHRTAPRQLVSVEKFFYPLDAISQWNRMYGTRGFVQYQIAVPQANGRAGLRTILDRLARSGRASFLAVLKRLALDIPVARGLVPFLRELDRMTLDYGGRVYLAKDAVLRAEDFATMYPRLESFRAVQRHLDPKRLLSSSLARRLRIVEEQ